MVVQTTWLTSSGRSATCTVPDIQPNFPTGQGTAYASCNTILPPPPYGATGTGKIATFNIYPGADIGFTTFNISDSYLVDTPANPDNQTTIPALVRSINIQVSPCADFPVKDGRVRIADVLYVVNRYRGDDMTVDLNGDGIITVADILIAVGMFNQDCPT
jgi:hypothetical protein